MSNLYEVREETKFRLKIRILFCTWELWEDKQNNKHSISRAIWKSEKKERKLKYFKQYLNPNLCQFQTYYLLEYLVKMSQDAALQRLIAQTQAQQQVQVILYTQVLGMYILTYPFSQCFYPHKAQIQHKFWSFHMTSIGYKGQIKITYLKDFWLRIWAFYIYALNLNLYSIFDNSKIYILFPFSGNFAWFDRKMLGHLHR